MAAASPYDNPSTATATEYPLPQRRNLVTEVPGPRSVALHARRAAAVAGGVSSFLPVYAAEAAGGVVVDVDGNSLIDLGSGIAVTSVGNAAPGWSPGCANRWLGLPTPAS